MYYNNLRYSQQMQLTKEVMQSQTEDLREIVSHFSKTIQEEFRGWTEFLEFFRLPGNDRNYVKKRVFTNLIYFRVNYFVLLFCVSTLTAICFNPLIFVLETLGVILGMFVFRKYKNPLAIRGKLITKKQRVVVFSLVMLCTSLVLGTTMSSFFVLGFSSLLVFAHSITRPRSLRSKFGSMGSNVQLGSRAMLNSENEENLSEDEQMEGGSLGMEATGHKKKIPAFTNSSRHTPNSARRSTVEGSNNNAGAGFILNSRNEAYARRREQAKKRLDYARTLVKKTSFTTTNAATAPPGSSSPKKMKNDKNLFETSEGVSAKPMVPSPVKSYQKKLAARSDILDSNAIRLEGKMD